MSYSYKVEDEIEECFKSDPKLINKTIKEMCKYFYMQGELKSMALRDAERSKVEHYRNKLNPEDKKLADKEWN